MNKLGISIVALVALGLTVTACTSAQHSTDVNPQYTSTYQFDGMNCKQLRREADDIRYKEPQLASRVDKHFEKQKDLEQAGWWLFWPAFFAMDDGSGQSDQLARLRGDMEAITRVMRAKDC